MTTTPNTPMPIQTLRQASMSLYDDLEKTLRSTGYVTGGQANELARAVEVLINVREKALHDGVAALQARLETVQALLNTAQEGTDAMNSDEYRTRAVETMDALSDAGLFEPIDVNAIVSQSKTPLGRVRLVIDNTGGTVHSTLSNYPVDIVIVRRDQEEVDDSDNGYMDLNSVPVALFEATADGYGDNEEVEHFFFEITSGKAVKAREGR
ncbi:hypothetical protein [Pseudomonas sp. NPDC089569]|uniref:hypothetical protein n=1 Tax=Pseudomonas sp. NPDC089569 TaxID=3390722 RepID=UPI003D00A292